MKQERFQSILNIISDVDENPVNELRSNILIIFKNLIGEIDTKSKDMFWFETKNIKNDKDYYQLISSYIDIMILYFDKKKIFDFETLKNEILNIAENNKYSTIFKLTRELFNKLYPSELKLDEIYISYYFLGFKKNVP